MKFEDIAIGLLLGILFGLLFGWAGVITNGFSNCPF